MRFQMSRRCPECGSTNVRRSGRLESEAAQYPFHSPYRCRDCDQRFWVVSRKALYGAAVGGVMFAMLVVLWSGLHLIARHDAPTPGGSALELRTEIASADARVLGDTLLRQWGPRLDVPDSSRRP